MTVFGFNGKIIDATGSQGDRIDVYAKPDGHRVRITYQSWPTSGQPKSMGFEFPVDMLADVLAYVRTGELPESWVGGDKMPDTLDDDMPTPAVSPVIPTKRRRRVRKKQAAKKMSAPKLKIGKQ